MNNDTPNTTGANNGRTALVTGATSGLGEEAAAQLAAAGYSEVIVTGRTAEKAEAVRTALIDRTGRDVFSALELNLDSTDAVDAALDSLTERGDRIDVAILNAGLVSGKDLRRTEEGIEITFAATLTGHHRLTMGLLDRDLLSREARIVIAGSEAARNDVPTFSTTDLPKFAAKHFDDNLVEAAEAVIRQEPPVKFNPANTYADAKMFVAWWSAALARRLPDGMTVNTVSPGSAPATQAARNAPFFMRNIMMPMMKRAPKRFGFAAPVSTAAARYVEASTFGADVTGNFFASKPKKMTGPLFKMDQPHIIDETSQEAAWKALVAIVGTDVPATPKSSPIQPLSG
jgi:NAD(P)-dependent dehydrogenase (short-subunit alcohol dehydrogenase family)